ncbi:MAG: FAD-dependent oxidoreductase, partial [Thermoplasmatales archaeon]|nr:FAD-dependent oxidoreductase [Thermoplasmatales archaeon]
DSLILATGAKPFIPPIQNIQRNGALINGVHVLRTIDDGKQISSVIEKGKKATIVGAGLIGLEVADSFYKKGLDVTIVEALQNILENTIDNDMCDPILKKLHGKIELYTNHIATKVEEKDRKINQVFIKDNKANKEKKVETDVLVIATGTKPDVPLAKSIGCKIGKTSGIIVNEKAETSVKNVYAVGDCTEYKDFVTKESICIGLGSIVVRQAIAAGINAADGKYNLLKGVLLTRTSEFFGIEIAAVGPVKNACQNIPVLYGKFKGSSLPDYFPGGKPILMKVGVHEETGKIVSAQAVGSNAAQRINTFACAILNGTNVEDFKKMETAYAPPIAPTLDVLTLVCDVASLKLARKRR